MIATAIVLPDTLAIYKLRQRIGLFNISTNQQVLKGRNIFC